MNFKIEDLSYSFHIIGQLVDFIQWIATATRYKIELRKQIVNSKTNTFYDNTFRPSKAFTYQAYKTISVAMSRFAYAESKILGKLGTGMAIDITAIKSG